MIHIYIGDGKGKTTAALGLALRASGAGKRVYFCQFIKDSKFICCEAGALKKAGIKFERFKEQVHPIFDKNGKYSLSTSCSIASAMKKIGNIIKNKSYDVIVLDEILNCWSAGFIKQHVLCEFLNQCGGVEIILTGRKSPAGVIKMADYVSLIKKVKHPFDHKIIARKGIEY